MTAYAIAGEIPQPSGATASSPVQSSTATGDSSTDRAGTRTASAQGALQPSSKTAPTVLSTTSIQSLQGALQHSYTIHQVGTTTTTATVTPTITPTTSRQDAAVSSSQTAAPSSTPQENGNDDNANPAVPIGVGVAFGASIMIAAGVLGFFYLRKRRRETPVRAETPPPFEFSVMDSQAPGRIRPFWEAPGYMGTRLPELRGGSVRCELP